MQGYIDEIKAKFEDELITEHEAIAMALGRCSTVLMEHCAEVAAEMRDLRLVGVSAANRGMLGGAYKALSDAFLQDIEQMMLSRGLGAARRLVS